MIRVSILTISDRSSRGEREDLSGPALHDLIISEEWEIVREDIIPDDKKIIQETLATWSVADIQNVILTTGGTGFAPRDVTPEATMAVIDRAAPGLVEAMRTASLEFTKHAMLSRAVAGIRGKTLIINLPGSPKAAVENLSVIIPVIPHAVQLMSDDSNAEAGHNLG